MKKIISMVLAVTLMFTATPSMVMAKAAKKPGQVTKVKLTNPITTGKKTNALTVSWKKAKHAKKYQVFMLKSKWAKYKTVKGCMTSVSKLKYGKTYKFKVRALNGKKKGKFSKVVRVVVHKNGKMTTYDSRGKKQVKPVGEGYKLVQLAKRHCGGIYKRKGTYLKDPKKKGDKNKIDCTGFVQAVYKKYANITLPPGSHKKMIKAALKIGKRVKSMEAAQMGDLVFYMFGKKNNQQHVAICAGNGMVIDASRSLNGVYVHKQSSKKPYCIVRVLRSGGARQVLTEEERAELEIKKVDEAFNKYYKKRGEPLPDKKYTFLELYKKNKSIFSDISQYDNELYIAFTDKAEKSRAAYAKKLVLPAQPDMEVDAKGMVKLTGNVENYYRMLISTAWLTTGNYAFIDEIASYYNRIDSITIKNGETFVNVSNDDDISHQIIFKDATPLRSYYGCKEGDKFLVEYADSDECSYDEYTCYPITLSKEAFAVNEEDYDYLDYGAGIGIIEVGKPIPIMYDSQGKLVPDFKFQGYRKATPGFIEYDDGDGSGHIALEKYKQKNQKEYDGWHRLYVRKYDEKELQNEYNNIKDRVKEFKCADGTVIKSYDEFKKLCETGMYPYNDELKKLFESLLEKDKGYFATFM